MPMLMTSVIGWPSAPRTRPSRTSAAKASILSRSASTVGRDVDAVDQDRRAGKVAQRAVQRRAPLGRIDELAAEHRVALGGDVGRLGEREQQPRASRRRSAAWRNRRGGRRGPRGSARSAAGSAAKRSGTERASSEARRAASSAKTIAGVDSAMDFPFPARRSMRCARPAAPSMLLCRPNCNCETSA